MNDLRDKTPLAAIREFLKLESAAGMLLVIAGVLAMLAANTPLAGLYDALLQVPFGVRLGSFHLDKPLLLWINDLLMAIFFLLVGLEIKREVVMGELSSVTKIALPAFAAAGGMLVPVALYAWLNWQDPVGIRGWAIPGATDIAFALGILALFGARVPLGLKVFLMTLAVLDDLGAIVIIALFYSGKLSMTALAGAPVGGKFSADTGRPVACPGAFVDSPRADNQAVRDAHPKDLLSFLPRKLRHRGRYRGRARRGRTRRRLGSPLWRLHLHEGT